MTPQSTNPTSNAKPQAAPLAIVGIGCLFPKADGVEQYWANIKRGVDAISDIPATHWNPADYFNSDPAKPDMTYARRGGFIDPVDFNPLHHGIAPNNIEATDTTQLLGMVVAEQALRDAGYETGRGVGDGKPFNRDRCSVILGVTGTLELVIPLGARLGHPIWRKALTEAGVDAATTEDVVERIADGYVPWQENSFPGLLGNVAAGRIANRFDLGGTNCVVDAACASSLSAIHLAAMELQTGKSDMVLTGGLDTFNDIFMYMCFSKTPALSPTGNAKPFDANGDGTILGEGLGVVVLKRLDDAVRDGDRIYCVIRGIGSSSDGKGNAIYAPSANGQKKCLRNAYEIAGVTPDTIELVEGHGTGTKVGDATEVKALAEVFSGTGASVPVNPSQPAPNAANPPSEIRNLKSPFCAIGSVKSMIGHTKAAAGVAGLIKAAMALHHRVLPPTIKVTKPLDTFAADGPIYVNTEARPWVAPNDHERRAALSAFGFGGSNFHCVLEEFAGVDASAKNQKPDWCGQTLLLALSADNRDDLKIQLQAFASERPWAQLRREARATLRSFQRERRCRLLLVVEKDRTPLSRLIAAANAQLDRQPDALGWALPDGIYFAAGATDGKLAFLFPGQGSQSVGMLGDLACQFPQMLDALSAANATFSAGAAAPGARLSDFIYPVPAFDDAARAAQEQTLRDTRIAQPALGAVSLGALGVLKHFGVKPAAVAGHSFGELVALHEAGVFDAAALAQLAGRRGQLMAEAGSASGSTSGMLAVFTSIETVKQALSQAGITLEIANHNAPEQVVLTGPTAAIEQAVRVFTDRKIRAKPLPVAAAFHSPAVSAAAKPFADAIAQAPWNATRIPVYANTTAEPYPSDASAARAGLAEQLARPVQFVAMIERMCADGVRTFVEVGPGRTLTGLVRSILGDRPHTAISLDASAGKRHGEFDLACLLAQLAALGVPVELPQWDDVTVAAEPPAARKPAMTIKLSGANYVKPREKREPRKASKTNELPAPTTAVSQPPVTPPTPVRAAPNTVPRAAASSTTLMTPSPMSSNSTPSPQGAAPSQVAYALQLTQHNILALQRMQEQMALLHKQYLDSQDQSQRTLHQMMEQQQALLAASMGQPWQMPALPLPPMISASVPAFAPLPAPPAFTPLPPMPQVSVAAAVPAIAPPPPAPRATPAPVTVTSPASARPQASPAPVAAARTSNPPVAQPVSRRAAAPNIDKMQSALLAVVADKTGYPVEMLELDMSLDADLGIDSIKRVEILSALQERLPDAPVVKPEDLGRLQTLRQIVDFLGAGAGAAAAPNAASNAARASTSTLAAPATIAPAGAPASSSIEPTLLKVVADKTGYPVEMLELDMSLDADLGIDSIKRVEILSALQERLPDAPVVKPEDLGRLQTLRQIVEFLASDGSREGPPSRTVQANSEAAADSLTVQSPALSGAVREGRRPFEFSPDAIFAITNDDAALASALADRLSRRGVRAQVIAAGDALPDQLAGVVLTAAQAGAPEKMEATWHALATLQRAAPMLKRRSAAGGTAVIAATLRMDGNLGLTGGPYAAGAAALCGIVKTAAREWPAVACKVIDASPALAMSDAAAEIVGELLREGPLEIAITAHGPHAVELTPVPRPQRPTPPVTPGQLIIITGGARGVTAQCAIEIAAGWKSSLLLLGRSDIPETEAPWLAGLTGEQEIKRAIASRADKANASPKAVQQAYERIAAAREIRQTIAAIHAAGGRAMYRGVDVRDAAAVAAAVTEARRDFGAVRGIIHGAGVLADRLIEAKTREQLDLVYSTKVAGLTNLLAAAGDDELKVLATFSSSTARFGRKGQVDYAAANEVLNKLAQREARQRPGCRVVSFNWGPWDGGMVTPALRGLFASEGVGVIPLKAGARLLVEQLSTPPGGAVEIVVLAPVDSAATGDEPQTPATGAAPTATHPLVATSASQPALHIAFERQASVESMPILRSHVLGGKAVLPAAIMIEWLAQGALHGHPGLAFQGLDQFRVLRGVKLDADDTVTLQVLAGHAPDQSGAVNVPVELRSGAIVHARAIAVLGPALPARCPALATPDLPEAEPLATPYRGNLLFHGPSLEAVARVRGCGPQAIAADLRSAPPPAAWMTQPIRATWIADPLVIDGVFQLAILWSQHQRGAGCLPTGVARLRQYQRKFPIDGCRAVLRVVRATEHAGVMDVQLFDTGENVVASMEGFEFVIDASLRDAFLRNQLPLPTPA